MLPLPPATLCYSCLTPICTLYGVSCHHSTFNSYQDESIPLLLDKLSIRSNLSNPSLVPTRPLFNPFPSCPSIALGIWVYFHIGISLYSASIPCTHLSIVYPSLFNRNTITSN